MIRIDQLFEYWLNSSAIPTWSFMRIMAYFTKDDQVRKEKLLLFAAWTLEGNNEYFRYIHWEKRTYIEVLNDFPTTKVPLNYLIKEFGL